MSLAENYKKIHDKLPKEVTLIAVSKTKPVAAIQELYNAGVRDFGENKIQEMCEKYEALPKDIRWHMIGHVQSNKVKYMAHFVTLIHGVDKSSLLKEINKRAKTENKIQQILLQVKIAKEDSKQGMDLATAKEILNSKQQYKNIQIVGLMGMATLTEDTEQIRTEFASLNHAFLALQKEHPELKILSMGMSGDYHIAIQEGSTMVRIGSKIFGKRNYS